MGQPWWDNGGAPRNPAWAGVADTHDMQGVVAQLGQWDRCMIGGNWLPGSAVVTGAHKHVLEVKKVPGQNGATTVDHGRELSKFNVVLTLWTQAQWDEWCDLAPKLQPLKQDKLQPLFIYHPALTPSKITDVFVEEIGFPKLLQGGKAEVSIKLLEYRAPKKGKSVTLKKSSGGLAGLDQAKLGGPQSVAPVPFAQPQSIDPALSPPSATDAGPL